MRSIETLMVTVPGLCAILPDWDSATFRRNTEIEVEALMVESYCKGGSEYSEFLNFQNSIVERIFLRNAKNGHFEPKKGRKLEQQPI